MLLRLIPTGFARLLPAACLSALLAACGGGGGGSAAEGDGGTTTPVDPTPTLVVTTLPGTLLSGVAITGAPVSNATVQVIDADGNTVKLLDAAGAQTDTARTSVADGSFRLTLASARQRLPLLLQARGVDATGAPVLLHSALLNGTAPLVAHVTPLTDAALSMVFGAPAQTVYATAAASTTTIALLGTGTAVVSASEQLKTIIKASFTDAKITDTKPVDLFKDAALAADKTGQDNVLEGLRLQYGKDNAGQDQLQLGHKFLFPRAPEVRVNLATARTELAKPTGGNAALAIATTLKATTSPSTVLGTLANLEQVSAGLNQLIARGASAAEFLASPYLPVTYTRHNGRTREQLAAQLARYAQTNYQLGKWQLVGCADDPVAAKTCNRVVVSALLTNQAGEIVDVLTDAVSFTTPVAPSTVGWRLAGNNLGASVQVLPVGVLALDAALAPVASSVASPNPGGGVQVLARAQDFAAPAAPAIDRLFVQIPSGFSVRLAACSQAELCVAPSTASGTATVVATGSLPDSLVDPATTGWLSSVDAVRGARYVSSYSLLSSPTVSLTQATLLPADVPTGVAAARFPVPDAAIGAAALQAGTAVAWTRWAAAQPDLKLFQLRSVLRYTDPAAPSAQVQAQVVEASLPLAGSSSATLPANALPAGRTHAGRELLLGAQDGAGRRYFTRIAIP